MRWRPSPTTAVVLPVVISLVANLATNTVAVDARWWPAVVWTAVALLTALAVVAEIARGRADPGAAPARETLASVADDLAAAVREQWRDEAARRDLNDPYPLPVEWQPAEPGSMPDWSELVRLATEGAGRPVDPDRSAWARSPRELAAAGGLVRALDRVPTRRLVVLGEPGAGKTMLLVRLVLDLLAPGRRRPGDPVPVLVSAASWHPGRQGLHAWLAERLALDYPALRRAVPRPGGRDGRTTTLARRLIDEGLVIMLLDGLDEIPYALRRAAIAGVNEALRPGETLVVTSRTSAFQDAVGRPAGGAARLTGAAVVRLCPLAPTEVMEYLERTAGGPAGVRRWAPLAGALTGPAPGVLAQVMTTPLMTTLARTIYNPRPDEDVEALSDPAELLELPSREHAERHLLDGFLRSAYRRHPAADGRWSVTRAERWLSFLADHLERDRDGSPDLAWWRLPDPRGSVTGPIPTLVAGVLVAAVAGLAAGLLYGLAHSFAAGVIVGANGAGVTGLIYGLVRWLTGRIGAALTAALVAGLAGGLAADIAGDLMANGASSLDVVVAAGLAAGLTLPLRPDLPTGLRAGAYATVAAWLAYAVSAIVVYLINGSYESMWPDAAASGLSVGVLVGVVVHLTNARSGGDGPWRPGRLAATPARAGAIVGTIVAALHIGGLGLLARSFDYARENVGSGLTAGLAAGLVVGLGLHLVAPPAAERAPAGGRWTSHPALAGLAAGAAVAAGYGGLAALAYRDAGVVVEAATLGLVAGTAVAVVRRLVPNPGAAPCAGAATPPLVAAGAAVAVLGCVAVIGPETGGLPWMAADALAAVFGMAVMIRLTRTPPRLDRATAVSPPFVGLGFGLFYSIVFFPLYGLAVGLVAGLAVELTGRLARPREPARSLRWSPRGVLAGAVIGIVTGITAVTRYGPVPALSVALTVALVVALVYGVDAPHHIRPVLSPQAILATDRRACLLITAAITLAVTMAVGLTSGLGQEFDARTALLAGTPYGLATGALIAAGRTAWVRYAILRCCLAAAGHLPWRFVSFLADAHLQRGVLRLNGATYQFRHLDLQRRLAAGYANGADPAHPARAGAAGHGHRPAEWAPPAGPCPVAGDR